MFLAPLLSIALLLGSIAGSVALWFRNGETRAIAYGALFSMVAAQQGALLWTEWETPFGFSSASVAAGAGVVAGGLSVFAIVSAWLTSAERDRVETLHWDTMEAVRSLNELETRSELSFDEKLDALLAIGSRLYGLEVGLVSRLVDGRMQVVYVRGPEAFPLLPGSVLPLAASLFGKTIATERPLAVENVVEVELPDDCGPVALRLHAYLGACVRVAGEPFGALSFASLRDHAARFTGTDKDLIALMAQLLGREIERRDWALDRPRADLVQAVVQEALDGREAEDETPPRDEQAPAGRVLHAAAQLALELPARSARAGANGAAYRSASASAGDGRGARSNGGVAADTGRRRSRGSVDANETLLRMERELRSLAGPKVQLALKLASHLAPAAVQRVPLDAIARTLVLNARDAMPDGGELVIETANVELKAESPGVVPAIAPARYVTLSVSDSGSPADADADTLSRLYAPTAPETSTGPDYRDPDGRLALSTVYRVLQICGGDLSVCVEQGRGTSFIVFLPRAEPSATARAATADAAADPLAL